MSNESPFAGEPADTHEAIMMATALAFDKHGYTGLSIQRIADESDLSKSTFYHHFEGKDDLLLSFVKYMREFFEAGFRIESTGDPLGDLQAFVTIALGQYPEQAELAQQHEPTAVYLELRAQSVQNPQFREEFTEMSYGLVDSLADIIQAGIDQGVFADVDPEATAEFILATLEGINLQQTTRTDSPTSLLREELDRYIEQTLLTEES